MVDFSLHFSCRSDALGLPRSRGGWQTPGHTASVVARPTSLHSLTPPGPWHSARARYVLPGVRSVHSASVSVPAYTQSNPVSTGTQSFTFAAGLIKFGTHKHMQAHMHNPCTKCKWILSVFHVNGWLTLKPMHAQLPNVTINQ